MRFRHILRADQFDRHTLDRLYALTNRIRKKRGTRDGALWLRAQFPHRRAILYFLQSSSRTWGSFVAAAQNLGMDTLDIRDPRVSSEVKGEASLDSIRTFSSYADVIIMRVNDKGLAAKAAEHMDSAGRPIPIINGGSGPDEHPTQACLDDYTLRRSFKERGGIDGKTIALVGDLKRGRTVRSLARFMQHYTGVKLLLVSPPPFAMEKDVLDFLQEHEIRYAVTDNFDQAVAEADAVYMTRIQDEHDTRGESAGVDFSKFCFTERHLKILKPHSIVMHPLPRREELSVSCDKDPRVMIWRQERNGMHVRTALLLRVLREQEMEKRWGGPLPKHIQDQLWLLDSA
ncbi:aspartate carbamoyltransferase [Patescibacteria group bacterium]|nr:aspartate carbamoyltransferase [Patescibacteria group bacterium]MBU1034865.1 aspartate carbamoyltransferase [Patescibacteria group bacterium]MBU1629793.1 aspartate carbamoyltransferase [Patescibacteria group bacterium]MBU1907780.1 aspartate carbamoyltransferase [Patescibacteria group bacterium]